MTSSSIASAVVLSGLEIAERHLGLDELSRRLGATPATIGAWRSGDVHMPDREFSVLVDLLGDLEPGWLSRERES